MASLIISSLHKSSAGYPNPAGRISLPLLVEGNISPPTLSRDLIQRLMDHPLYFNVKGASVRLSYEDVLQSFQNSYAYANSDGKLALPSAQIRGREPLLFLKQGTFGGVTTWI